MIVIIFLKGVFVKKTFTLHMDAILVLILLFITLLALTLFLQSQVTSLTTENKQLQWKSLENSLNLDSQASYIKKLQVQLEESKKLVEVNRGS